MFIFQIAQLPNAGVGGPPLPNAGVGGQPPLPNAGQNNLPNAGADPFIPAQIPGQVPLPGGITAQELANQLRISLQLYGRRSGLGTLPAAQRMNLLPNGQPILTSQANGQGIPIPTVDELLAQHPHLANEAPVTSLLTTHQTQFTNLQTALTTRAIELGRILNNPSHATTININDQLVFNGPSATSRPVHEVVSGLSTQISTLIARYRSVLGADLTDNQILLQLASPDPQVQAQVQGRIQGIDLNPQDTALLADLTRIASTNSDRDGADPAYYGSNYLNGLARQVIIGRSLGAVYTEQRTAAGEGNFLLSGADLQRISTAVYTNENVVELGIRETPFENGRRSWNETTIPRSLVHAAALYRGVRAVQNGYQLIRLAQGLDVTVKCLRGANGIRTGATTLMLGGRVATAGAGRVVPVLGAVLAVADCGMDWYNYSQTGSQEDLNSALINTGCTAGGAIIGGILGSILPGPGTVIGACIGASVGNLVAMGINAFRRSEWGDRIGAGISRIARATFVETPRRVWNTVRGWFTS